MRRFTGCCLFILLLAVSSSAHGQTIEQSRGVDARVDYASLTQFGPWDDRNYQLNQADLELLAGNEAEQRVAVPAFYRVQLRREFKDMLRTGDVQYPRSSLPRFLVEYGGYQVEGKLYRAANMVDGNWELLPGEQGIDPKSFDATKALEGEVIVNGPGAAAESAIAINPVNPDQVIAGANGPGSGQRMFYSDDGGETWQTSANSGALPLGGTCCDPTIDWSSDGTKAYTATLGSGVFVYRSADGGQTWTDFETITPGDPRRELGGGVDKEYLHVDRYPTSPNLDNIYLSWHQGNVLRVANSTDFGDTWTTHVFSSANDKRGIGSDLTTDKQGNVYHFWPATNSQKIWLAKSTDGGMNWAPEVEVASTLGAFDFPIPSMNSRRVFIYNAAATDFSDGPFANSIYASWTDNTGPDSGNAANNHARIQVAYSRDGGATWAITNPHATADSNTVDRWHQWIGVGPDGTVYAGFYDTRNSTGRSGVDFYVARSMDGAQTWSAPERLTSVTSQSLTGFQFGDYNGLDIQMDQLITIFTDSRDENGGAAVTADVYSAGFITTPPIFADGFESGDTSAWDITEP